MSAPIAAASLRFLGVLEVEEARYVGSALGQDSLWGRWCDYARTGHGGDRELRKLGRRLYQVTILQAVPMISPDDDVLATESLWKEKLMTRRFGLNAN